MPPKRENLSKKDTKTKREKVEIPVFDEQEHKVNMIV